MHCLYKNSRFPVPIKLLPISSGITFIAMRTYFRDTEWISKIFWRQYWGPEAVYQAEKPGVPANERQKKKRESEEGHQKRGTEGETKEKKSLVRRIEAFTAGFTSTETWICKGTTCFCVTCNQQRACWGRQSTSTQKSVFTSWSREAEELTPNVNYDS